MLREINLLRALPPVKRDVAGRRRSKNGDVGIINAAKQFGEMYFDGPRAYGYGGYYYDGRWIPVARDIIEHFGSQRSLRILDVGCAKGFLVNDLVGLNQHAFGLDISRYALDRCPSEMVGRLHLGSAEDLPFPDNSFDAVVSINTIHNLPRPEALRALREIQRVSGGWACVVVDSYRTPEQRQLFLDWTLTAEFHGYPEDWLALFKEASYTGDYWWNVLEE